MNQPKDNQPEDLEARVEKIEEVFADIVKNEDMIIKLSKRQTFNLQKIRDSVENVELDTGDARERFDTIERNIETIKTTMATKDDVGRLETLLLKLIDRFPQPDGE